MFISQKDWYFTGIVLVYQTDLKELLLSGTLQSSKLTLNNWASCIGAAYIQVSHQYKMRHLDWIFY